MVINNLIIGSAEYTGALLTKKLLDLSRNVKIIHNSNKKLYYTTKKHNNFRLVWLKMHNARNKI